MDFLKLKKIPLFLKFFRIFHSFYFLIFIGIIALLFLAISFKAIFGISENITFSEKRSSEQVSSSLEKYPKLSVSPFTDTPSNTFNPRNYQIIAGSVYKVFRNGNKEIIVNKSDLKHEQLMISGVDRFELSPDNSKILLLALGGITPYIAYYKNLTTDTIVYVGFALETCWSPDSRYIAYTRPMSDAGPFQIKVFDTLKNTSIDTIQLYNPYTTSYSNLHWNSNGKSLKAHFDTFDAAPFGNKLGEGEVDIKIKK